MRFSQDEFDDLRTERKVSLNSFSVIKQYYYHEWHFVTIANEEWVAEFTPFLCFIGDKKGCDNFILNHKLNEDGFVEAVK